MIMFFFVLVFYWQKFSYSCHNPRHIWPCRAPSENFMTSAQSPGLNGVLEQLRKIGKCLESNGLGQRLVYSYSKCQHTASWKGHFICEHILMFCLAKRPFLTIQMHYLQCKYHLTGVKMQISKRVTCEVILFHSLKIEGCDGANFAFCKPIDTVLTVVPLLKLNRNKW